MKLQRCAQLPLTAISGIWYRALHSRFAATPLATAHTATLPGRFNHGTPSDPAFEVLYLASDFMCAQLESQALLGSLYPTPTYVPNPHGSWIVVPVFVNLQSVVDLRPHTRCKLLQTSTQELTGDWGGYWLRKPSRKRGGIHGSDVPTQRLGAALERIPSIEAFICYSARMSTHGNLIVFPNKLDPLSWVECRNPTTGLIERIP